MLSAQVAAVATPSRCTDEILGQLGRAPVTPAPSPLHDGAPVTDDTQLVVSIVVTLLVLALAARGGAIVAAVTADISSGVDRSATHIAQLSRDRTVLASDDPIQRDFAVRVGDPELAARADTIANLDAVMATL